MTRTSHQNQNCVTRSAGGVSQWRNSAAVPFGVPAAPTAVNVTHHGSSLRVSWPAAGGADSYHVTYSSDHGVSWQLATPKQTSTSLTINGVSSAKAYKVRVRAKNASGYSGWRISASASPPVPDAVAEVRVVHQGSSLAVSWPVPTGASVYHVTYSDANPISWQLAASEHRSTSLIITGVESSKTYLVGLRAANAIGDWSGWVNSAPAAPPALSVADQVLEPQFWIRSGGAWDAGHGVRNADFAHFALGLCQGVSCPQPAWQSHRDNRTRKKAKRKWRPGRGMAARHRRQRP